MFKTYIFLVGAIFCEVAGTMLLPASQNFTKLLPTVALSVFYLTAFYLLTFVVNKLPLCIKFNFVGTKSWRRAVWSIQFALGKTGFGNTE